MDETSTIKLVLDFIRIRCQSLLRVKDNDASVQLRTILLLLAPNIGNSEITCTHEVQNLIIHNMLDLFHSSRSHLGETETSAESTVDGKIGSQTMQGNISNGLHFGSQRHKPSNVYSTCDKEVENRHYCSIVYELSLHCQIQQKPLDKSNNYNSDHEKNDASSQTDPSSLDFFAAPAQLTTTDLSVRGRLEVWVQKSQNDSSTRIEFIPYGSNSEANILQASRHSSKDSHILSPNTIHRKGKSRRILKIPKTTTVQNILRLHQNKIPDQLKESHESVTLENSSSRTIKPTSSVSDTWLNDSNSPRKHLDLRRYRFQQQINYRKQIQCKPDMIETRTKTDNGQKALPNGEHQEKREHKMILIKNLWRAKYMSDVDMDDADWKSKINPMHIVIDEHDIKKIEEFKRKIEGRLDNDNRLRRRMAGIRIVVLGPFRTRAVRTRQGYTVT